ncbi:MULTISPECIES: phage holin family protein [Klebsiella]|uniref:Phage holin family protein n=1 Tax=Klebsiella michiganensis TaxID=1134687 RepID=A0AB35WCY7_9ENTR|nr:MULTISPECIES: phage holin family protein [Klebsiella]STR70129.1 membrane protein [Raoultella ornithinolytica]HDU4296629.1 phage holin family protein [Klebsiella variicola]ELG4821918.1 phage holin family protein [Klebsiella oxytoca]ELK5565151.1 phage holin family protein [Klebsiella oxytoca]ELK5575603.1 phage holin family protein [Klebsiella oxytoca]
MVLNDPTATINALLCAGVVVTLMFYRRRDSRHRKWVSRLAWLITVIYSSVPLAYLCGIYPYSTWPTIGANIMILVVLLSVRGNVARLVDALRH